MGDQVEIRKRVSMAMVKDFAKTHLPGAGAVYLGQNLSFRRPIFVDDEVVIVIKVVKVREDKPILTLQTNCRMVPGSWPLKVRRSL